MTRNCKLKMQHCNNTDKTTEIRQMFHKNGATTTKFSKNYRKCLEAHSTHYVYNNGKQKQHNKILYW